MKPTKEEVEKFQVKAALEYGLTMTYEEAERFIVESNAEELARDRR